MPLFGKRKPAIPQSSSSSDGKHTSAGRHISLRAYLSDKVRSSIHCRPSQREISTSITRPTRVRQASIEDPVCTASPSQDTQFLYEDIDPPAGFFDSLSRTSFLNGYSQVQQHKRLEVEPTTMINEDGQASSSSSVATSLPGYNDVSGAVVVDWDGYPRFLSPQEEQERKAQLELAVRERMLGLPRRTDFIWEQSHHASLPQYSPAKDKASPRPSLG